MGLALRGKSQVMLYLNQEENVIVCYNESGSGIQQERHSLTKSIQVKYTVGQFKNAYFVGLCHNKLTGAKYQYHTWKTDTIYKLVRKELKLMCIIMSSQTSLFF